MILKHWQSQYQKEFILQVINETTYITMTIIIMTSQPVDSSLPSSTTSRPRRWLAGAAGAAGGRSLSTSGMSLLRPRSTFPRLIRTSLRMLSMASSSGCTKILFGEKTRLSVGCSWWSVRRDALLNSAQFDRHLAWSALMQLCPKTVTSHLESHDPQ